jgi:hypothetical protein
MLTHPCRTLRKHDSVCHCQTYLSCTATCIIIFDRLLLTQLLQLCNLCQKIPLHIAIMGWRMMLCEVIRQVCPTRLPIYPELPLLLSIQEPFEPHIHQFSALWLDTRINIPLRCQVICLNRSGQLGVAHLLQYTTHMHGLLSIDE